MFGVGLSTVYGWIKQGKLRRFEVRRPIGARQWSGRLLQDWVATSPVADFEQRQIAKAGNVAFTTQVGDPAGVVNEGGAQARRRRRRRS